MVQYYLSFQAHSGFWDVSLMDKRSVLYTSVVFKFFSANFLMKGGCWKGSGMSSKLMILFVSIESVISSFLHQQGFNYCLLLLLHPNLWPSCTFPWNFQVACLLSNHSCKQSASDLFWSPPSGGTSFLLGWLGLCSATVRPLKISSFSSFFLIFFSGIQVRVGFALSIYSHASI